MVAPNYLDISGLADVVEASPDLQDALFLRTGRCVGLSLALGPEARGRGGRS